MEIRDYLAVVVQVFFDLLVLIIIAKVLLSWFPNVDKSNRIIQFIEDISRPFLRIGKRLIPPIGMLDISPIVMIFLLDLIKTILISLISGSYENF
jgi:YggT family protein